MLGLRKKWIRRTILVLLAYTVIYFTLKGTDRIKIAELQVPPLSNGSAEHEKFIEIRCEPAWIRTPFAPWIFVDAQFPSNDLFLVNGF